MVSSFFFSIVVIVVVPVLDVVISTSSIIRSSVFLESLSAVPTRNPSAVFSHAPRRLKLPHISIRADRSMLLLVTSRP